MRLYSPATTDFSTNGIGQLSSAISCFVEEKRNGSYELEMQYPVDGVHFSDIQHSCLIMAKPADGKPEQPFRIYKITKPLNKRVTVKARHISYQTSHIPVAPFAAASCAQALNGLKSNAAEACPFEFWTDKSTTANFSVEEPSSIRSRLGGTRGSILDTYGGEYEWDGYTIKLHENRGSDKGVTLRYGKNITDITQEENIENTITGVYPYWKGSEEGSTETLVELDEKVLHSANAQNFPYQMTVPLDMSSYFQNPPTQAQLRERAQAYMKANKIGIPSVSIKVSFLPLWQTEEYKELMNLERVNLCDTVTVIFERLGVEATAKVVRTKFNVLECGKGAQYDDVNNAVHTRAVINTVFAEHTRELGANAEEIAMDKCHVITSDTRTAWTAPQTEKVLGILAERADRMNAELRIWGEDFSSEDAEVSEYGTEFSVTVGDEDLGRFRVPLLGGFQARNCALALAAAHDILPHFDRDRIASILSSVSWPGRMDLISRDPAVIMDNCINRTSCSEVRSVLRDLGISEITAVIGIPDDKDFLGVAQEIAPMCRRMILTSSGNPHYRFTDMQTSVLAAAGIGSERIPGSAAALASAAADGRPVAILGTTSVISEIQALRESGMLAHIIGGID